MREAPRFLGASLIQFEGRELSSSGGAPPGGTGRPPAPSIHTQSLPLWPHPPPVERQDTFIPHTFAHGHPIIEGISPDRRPTQLAKHLPLGAFRRDLPQKCEHAEHAGSEPLEWLIEVERYSLTSRHRDQAARTGFLGVPIATGPHTFRYGAHRPASSVPPAVERSPCAKSSELASPCGAVCCAFNQNRGRGIQLREDTRIELAYALLRQATQIIEERGDPTRSAEEEGNELGTATVVIAPGASGDDDPDVLSSSSPSPGNYMLTGKGLIRTSGRPAVGALPALDLPLKFDSKGVGELPSLCRGA